MGDKRVHGSIVDLPNAEQILVKLLSRSESGVDNLHGFRRFTREPLCPFPDPNRVAHVEHPTSPLRPTAPARIDSPETSA